MKIFLGDLVHTWGKISVWTMPINIGFVSGYARAQVSDDITSRLFKRPEKMIDAIRAEKPDVVALSYYVWNIRLNALVARIAREANPDVLIVGGGPIFTAENFNEGAARRFLEDQPVVDLFVVNQGERAFAEAIGRFHACGHSRDELLTLDLPGVIVNDRRSGQVRLGQAMDPLRELDVIPSPYLNGALDEFFSERISPIVETNRSCPYRCTFCAWGIGTGKLAKFSEERVFAEIDYIAEHNPLSPNWFFADANFSILERDEEIARRLMTAHQKHGTPQRVIVQWNKSRPDRVLRVARALGPLAQPGASMQSLNEGTLEAIKRRNLPLDKVIEVIDTLNAEGGDTRLFSELIVGLPEETLETHLQANRTLIDLGAEVFNYNLHLLPGTEMDTPHSRESYVRQTGYRLHDNAFGIYDGVKVFEGQEVVLETPTMSRSEIRDIRFIHFLLQFMWARRHYYDYLQFLHDHGLHPVDAVRAIHAELKANPNLVSGLYDQFYELYAYEEFPTMESLVEFWTQPENLELLRSGEYGKLNALFTHRIELEHQEEFTSFLEDFATSYLSENAGMSTEDARTAVHDVLSFTQNLKVRITKDQELQEGGRMSFSHDFLKWRADGYQRPLSAYDRGKQPVEIAFSLSPEQRATIERLLVQFRSDSPNLTMRKMSEYSNPNLFLYNAHYPDAVDRDVA